MSTHSFNIKNAFQGYMSTFVGITPQFYCIFSRISRVFNENFNLTICILDHLVNMLCLRTNLKPGLVLKET